MGFVVHEGVVQEVCGKAPNLPCITKALEEAAAKQRQSRQEQRELYAHLTRKSHETHGAAWCAAEARKLNDSYFPGVSAQPSLCALASFSLAPPPA